MSKRVLITLPEELAPKIEKLAKKENRKFASMCAVLISRAI
jgi:hypothetical protein